ncbi:unnamed protein product [Auanema sp. JU1783]|nr:unnamed protein product [Auanema sp. JU1783]
MYVAAQRTIQSLILTFSLFSIIHGKIHHLKLRDDSRRNIILTSFGFDTNGTFDLVLSNFTVPDKILSNVDSGENADKLGVIGFSLSKGISIAAGVGSNPHVCQLQQTDQGYDALFFFADLPQKRLRVYRSGEGGQIRLCASHEECQNENGPLTAATVESAAKSENAEATQEKTRKKRDGWLFDTIKRVFNSGESGKTYVDYVPLIQNDNHYSTNISIRFNEQLRGKYYLIYHNCFNYRAHGYSDRVAVDFVVDIVEANVGSYLSAGDIPKPQLLLYISLMFFFTGVVWSHRLCLTDKRNIYRVHGLMTALIFLKSASLFFHGVNYYFVSKYGQQREIWAVVFYITHLLKGALLFGTIILIGTGYTFFKNFLSDRDRKVFMIVLPLQIIDNIAMVILEESENGQQGYQFWYEMFVFLDLICCFCVFFPIVWSIAHLQEGAATDGKSAFNLQKLRLFRQFYMIIICYIYLTRVLKFMLQYAVPFNLEWVTVAVVESATLFFFILVGMKFRPQQSNPYLELSLEDDEDENAIALTRNGLMENVVQRGHSGIGLEDIPGAIGDMSSDSDDDERLLIGRKRVDGLEKTLL